MLRDGRRTSHPDHPPPRRPLARRRVRRPGAPLGGPGRHRAAVVRARQRPARPRRARVRRRVADLPGRERGRPRPARHRAAGPGLRCADRPRDPRGRGRRRDGVRLRLGDRRARRRDPRRHARGLGQARPGVGVAADRRARAAERGARRRRGARGADHAGGHRRAQGLRGAARLHERPQHVDARPAQHRAAERDGPAADQGGCAPHARRAPARPLRARARHAASAADGAARRHRAARGRQPLLADADPLRPVRRRDRRGSGGPSRPDLHLAHRHVGARADARHRLHDDGRRAGRP